MGFDSSLIAQALGKPQPQAPAVGSEDYQNLVNAALGPPKAAPSPQPSPPKIVAPGAVQSDQNLLRPGTSQHNADPFLAGVRTVVGSVLNLGQIAAGTVRHLARMATVQNPFTSEGETALGYQPKTPEEQQDAALAQTGVALGASAVMASVAAPALAAVLPATVASEGMGATVANATLHVIRSLGVSEAAGATFGALRPTRPDESRMQAVQDGVLGFAAIDAALQGALGTGMALAGRLSKAPSLAGAQDVFTPKGVGPVIAAPNLLARDLGAVGVEPQAALDVALGRTTLADALAAQGKPELLAPAQQAAAARGYTWIADGRPLADYPHAPGERFYARPLKSGGFAVRLGDQTNTLKAYGLGPTVEDALRAAQPLAPTPTALPAANVTAQSAALTASPVNVAADPEFNGWLGHMREWHSKLFTDRFAGVRRTDPNLAGRLGNQAASDLNAGYTALLLRRLSGVEAMSDEDAQLVGRSLVAREGERMRTRAQAEMVEAQRHLASGEGAEWQTRFDDAQAKLQSAQTQPELQPLTHDEAAAIGAKPAVRDALRFYDERVQPFLEDFKVDAGLSAGSLEAATGEAPVFSLVPKRGALEAAGEEAAAQVETPAVLQPRTGGGPLQSRYRLKRTTAALERTGTAPAYETDIRHLTNAWISDVLPKNAERSTIEYLTRQPYARRLDAGERLQPGEGVLEFQKGKVPGSDVGGRWAVPRSVKRAYDDLATRRALFASDTERNAYFKFMDFWTQLQLAAPVEASSHFWRILSEYSRLPGTTPGLARAFALFPSLGPKGLAIANIARVGSDPAEMIEGVRTLARVGALTGRALPEAAHEGLTATIERSALGAPREWLFGMPHVGPGLDGVETRIRLAGLKFLREVVEPSMGRTATDQEIRQFVNGWGTYGQQMQPTFLAFLRKIRVASFGSFQTSAIPREIAQMWSPFLPGTSGGTGLPQTMWRDLPAMQRLAMRASVAWRGLVGDMVFRAATTKAASGYWPWDPPHLDSGHMLDIPVGTLGQGSEQRFVYLKANNVDPGMTRAWRTTGARALATGALKGDFWAGAGNAITDYANTLAGLAGPGLRFVFSAATGKAPYLTPSNELLQEAPTEPTRGGQVAANLGTALIGANPILEQVAGERGMAQSLSDPLSQAGAILMNATTPGMTVGPPRRVWRQSEGARDAAQLYQFVNERINAILNAPNPEAASTARADALQQLRATDLPAPLKRQAMRDLLTGVARKRRAQLRRGNAAGE